MTDTNHGSYVVAAQSGSFGLLSSVRCLWASSGNKSIYGPYERPPFPILNDAPTWYDVRRSLRLSDFFMGGSIYGFGMLWGYYASRPFTTIMQRLVVYHGISHMFLAFGVSLMIAVPYRRLTGFWDNGMRWSKPEDRLRKYDCTSHFEKATGWSSWKVSGDQ